MILLLTQKSIQGSTLGMMLKLKGYATHVVADEHEAINLIKNVPKQVRGVVVGGEGCSKTLVNRIEAFRSHHIGTPIIVVTPPADTKMLHVSDGAPPGELNLSVCSSAGLLKVLETVTG